jgi:hypothetical protein
MSTVYTIVECLVTYENGTSEIRRPTYAEIAVGLASVDHVSVINYLREHLQHVRRIEVLDTLYFRTQSDYENYLKTLK